MSVTTPPSSMPDEELISSAELEEVAVEPEPKPKPKPKKPVYKTVGWEVLAVPSDLGGVQAVGAASGKQYGITATGTWVREDDVESVLRTTVPPCCGRQLPFGGQWKPIYRRSADQRLMKIKPAPVRVRIS